MADTMYSNKEGKQLSIDELKKKYNLEGSTIRLGSTPSLPGEDPMATEEVKKSVEAGVTPTRDQWESAISGIDKLNDLYRASLEREKLERQTAPKKYPTNQEFTKQWFKDHGNPYDRNPAKEANQYFRTHIADLINHVFDGKKRLGDMFTESEQKVLNQAKQIFYTNIYNQIKSDIANEKDEYGLAIKNLTIDRAEFEKQMAKEGKLQEIAAETAVREGVKAKFQQPKKPTQAQLKGEILNRVLHDPDFWATANDMEKNLARSMVPNADEEAYKFAFSWIAKNDKWNWTDISDPKHQAELKEAARQLAASYKRMKKNPIIGKKIDKAALDWAVKVVGRDKDKISQLLWQMGYNVPGYSNEQ